MKNLLFMGSYDSPWNKIYLENVCKYNKEKYNIVYFGNCINNKEMSDFCNNYGIDYFFSGSMPKWIEKIPKIRGIFRYILNKKEINKIKNKYKEFEAIHIYFMDFKKFRFAKMLRKNAKNIICTFCGSDLYRESKLKLKLLSPMLNACDNLTFMTIDMKDYFINNISNKYNSKISVLDFGISMLDCMEDVLKDKDKCRKEIGLSEKDISIAIGYNGVPKQQHCKVINELSKLPQNIKDRIVIILQMTYGLSNDYHNEILSLLRKYDFRFIEYTKFLNSTDLAKIKVATDIFIHAQTSDAQAASVLEYLYAYKTVINPTWIKYSTLKNNDVFYEEYSDFYDIPNLVVKYCSDNYKKDIKNKLEHNHDFIEKNYTWFNLAPKWFELYKKSEVNKHE